jgi:hypothetical protein
VGLFQVNEASGHNMAIQLESLLSKFGLVHHVIAYLKYEGINLTTMAFALHSNIDCQPLRIFKVYEGTCFRHVMSKTCQYAINDDKNFKGLVQMNVKDA